MKRDVDEIEEIIQRFVPIRNDFSIDPMSIGGNLGKGERAILGAYRPGEEMLIVSDDRAFIKRLDRLAIPYLTTDRVLVLLYRIGAVSKEGAVAALERLRSAIPVASYTRTLVELSKGRQG